MHGMIKPPAAQRTTFSLNDRQAERQRNAALASITGPIPAGLDERQAERLRQQRLDAAIGPLPLTVREGQAERIRQQRTDALVDTFVRGK